MKDFLKFTETDYVAAKENYYNAGLNRNTMRLVHAIQGMMDEAGEIMEIALHEYVDEDQLKIELGDYYYFMNLFCDVLGIDFKFEGDESVKSLHHYAGIICKDSIELGKQIKNHFNYGSDLDLPELKKQFRQCSIAWGNLAVWSGTHVVEIESIMKRKLKKRYEKGYSKRAALNRDYKAEDQAALQSNPEDQSTSRTS